MQSLSPEWHALLVMQSRSGCNFMPPSLLHPSVATWTLSSRCTNKFAIETFQMSMDCLAAQVSEAAADGTYVIFWNMESRNLTPLKDNWFSVFYFPGVFLQGGEDYWFRLFFWYIYQKLFLCSINNILHSEIEGN